MTYLKAIIGGIVGGFTIAGVWDLQDVNYLAGTLLGLFLIFGAFAIVMNATKKGNN